MFCPQDSAWGPASVCRSLDFTLFFEESILTLTPDVVFLVFVTIRLYSLFPQTNKLAKPGRILLLFKCLASLFVVASSAAKLALYFQQQNGQVSVGMAAHVIQLVTSVPLAVLVLAEHFRSNAPSMLSICYATVKAIFSGAMLRTYVLAETFQSARSLAVASILVTSAFFLLFCVELVEKRRLLRSKTLPVVVTSSFLSRSLYLWLLPLLWIGRKKTITSEDYTAIPADLGASSTRSRLERGLASTSKNHPKYLFVASGKSFGLQFLSPVLPRIALLLVTFAQPVLVTKTISFVSDPQQPNEQGWLLVGGFVCVFLLISLTTSLYWEKVFDTTVAYRGALVGAIYSKTLRLSRSSSSSLGGGVASTYMSVDVERVCQGAEIFHELWSSIIAVFLAVILLYFQASWPAVLPLVVTGALLVMATFVGKRAGKSQAAWLAATDRRIKFITSVIHNFLPMKWSRYENALSERAASLRSAEMQGAARFYRNITVSVSVSNIASTLCTLSVLGPYSAFGTLDANRVFTIVTTVNLLSSPLSLLGQLLPEMAAAYASLKRIQGYLLLDETAPNIDDHPYTEIKSEKETVARVDITAASFAWSPEERETPFLKNISLSVDQEFLYTCVGPVASGKSLLLLSLLNETTRVSGEFSSTCSRVAYAQQDALIVPGSLRDNITFGKLFSQDRYDRVVEACGLTADIRKLKSGDGTFLGEKGARLSGGQRQRVGLARAVYAAAPLTLLDDPFSALDAETEAHVFRSLFGPTGLLKGKMVVLVTHNVKHLYSADHVIVMSSGAIVYQGTLTVVQEAGYTGLRDTGKTKVESSDTVEIISRGDEHIEETAQEEAPIAKASLGFTPYIFFARMSGSENFFVFPILIVLYSGTRLSIQLYLKYWSESDGTHLPAWIGGYAALLVLSLVALWGVFGYFTHLISTRIGHGVHAAEIKGLFGTSPAYAMTTSAGHIINRFSQDIFMSDFEFPLSFVSGFIAAVTLVGTVIFIMIPVPWLTLAVIPLGLVYYGTMTFYLKTSKQLQHLEASSKSPMYTLFSTTVSGLVTIRALQVEDHFMKQNENYLDLSQQPFYFRFGGVRFLRTLLSLISAVLAIGLATLAVGLRHATTASSLGLALSSVTSLTGLLTNILINLSSLENASVSISRIHEMVVLPAESDDNASLTAQVPAAETQDRAWPSRGSVTFDNLYLKYKPELDSVVKGVSFKIEAGQKIGICGRSGSGKSTIIMALFRALDSSLTSGRIEIDGVDIQSISLEKLRSSFSLVAQDPFLWNAPLRHNLDPQSQYTDQEIWMALKRVRMDEAVLTLPDQLESVLEDGGSLSKGQQQLICLARVLLRKRKIVVLDEASSSLDLDTDEQMRRVIETDLADCTVIAVAHRLATISNFDMIFVMEDGKLIESGAPQDLLSRPDSTFSQLAMRQGLRHVES